MMHILEIVSRVANGGKKLRPNSIEASGPGSMSGRDTPAFGPAPHLVQRVSQTGLKAHLDWSVGPSAGIKNGSGAANHVSERSGHDEIINA